MRVVYTGGEGEITEKKSRFIATVKPVQSEEEAVAFINETKKKYWDARHNCSKQHTSKIACNNNRNVRNLLPEKNEE